MQVKKQTNKTKSNNNKKTSYFFCWGPLKEIRDVLGRVLHRAHTDEVMVVEEGSTVEVRVPIFHEQQGIISIYKKKRNTEAPSSEAPL